MKRIVVAVLAGLLAACSGLGGGSHAGPAGALPIGGLRRVPTTPLSHVIVIIQENRSFENFFAGYPGANAPLQGCAVPVTTTHPRTTSSGCPNGDVVVPLKKITWKGPDLQHNWHSSIVGYHQGKMDGFGHFGTAAYDAYEYVDPKLSVPYWQIAQQYVLADAMFPTEFGGSFTGHLTLVAGNDNLQEKPYEAEVDFPNGTYDDCDSPPGTTSSYILRNRTEEYYKGPFPCFDQWNTMAKTLDQSGISWKMYASKRLHAGMWEPFEADKYVRYGPDWTSNIIAPSSRVLQDAANGGLASVDWVTPSKPDSDHPGDGPLGPSWVGSVINAIGESSYWNTSAIVVVWDDYGGWYDNAVPPQLDPRGLGIRVPCLIISPYAKQNYVSHVQYEYASILRFIEEVNGLPAGAMGPLSQGYTDGRAASLDDAFDFTQQPRKFTPLTIKYPMSHFLHEKPSDDPIDTE